MAKPDYTIPLLGAGALVGIYLLTRSRTASAPYDGPPQARPSTGTTTDPGRTPVGHGPG